MQNRYLKSDVHEYCSIHGLYGQIWINTEKLNISFLYLPKRIFEEMSKLNKNTSQEEKSSYHKENCMNTLRPIYSQIDGALRSFSKGL